jgi:UDP:flavonoid glycosyltransferase YjiC (YdhE family)
LDRARILFLSSNGTGLGHLTRSMAIARRLDPALEPLFVTFSAAAPVVRGLGFPVEYVASYDRPGAGDDLRWTRRARARLEALVGEARPAVVLFDGTHPYERLLPALRSSGAALVWSRRAMWRATSDTAPLWRSHLFDAVLEPGELAAEADVGPTARRRGEARVVDPIVLLDRSELLPRAEAERELGLEPGRVNALVQLGQGAGVREATARSLRHLAGRGGVQVAALSSALGALDDVPEGVVALRGTYPMSRYLAAFDLAVAAAGYNAYHELVHLGVPSLFVPIARDTDDQPARARYAAERGLARACAGPDDPSLAARLDELLDPDARGAISERLAELAMPNGAADAAQWLGGLAGVAAGPPAGAGGGRGAGDDGPRPGEGGPGLAARRAWIFAASVPQTLARLARQVLTRPRMRALIVALGLEGDELEGELRAALARLGENPERVLVVTDRLDFDPLLAAGVGFEHVPGPGERQAELAGVPYEELLRRRLGLILAHRPRPRRVIALGDASAGVLESAQVGGAARSRKDPLVR